MDTTETHNRHGSREKPAGDNVVRLPRDWLGPREELVPFGPSAERATSDTVTELPRSADDFWGGADMDDTAAATERAEALGAVEPRTRRPLPRLPSPRLAQPRVALALGLGLLAVLAAVGLVIGSGARTPAAPRARANDSVRSQNPAASFDTRANGLRDTAAAQAARVRARHAAAVRRRAELRRRRASARRHHQHRATSTTQAVHYTAPSAPAATNDAAGTSSSSGVSTGASGAASSTDAAGSSSPTTASSASTPSSSSSSNQPAIGANGSLGPGSSPDG